MNNEIEKHLIKLNEIDLTPDPVMQIKNKFFLEDVKKKNKRYLSLAGSMTMEEEENYIKDLFINEMIIRFDELTKAMDERNLSRQRRLMESINAHVVCFQERFEKVIH